MQLNFLGMDLPESCQESTLLPKMPLMLGLYMNSTNMCLFCNIVHPIATGDHEHAVALQSYLSGQNALHFNVKSLCVWGGGGGGCANPHLWDICRQSHGRCRHTHSGRHLASNCVCQLRIHQSEAHLTSRSATKEACALNCRIAPGPP